MDEKITVWRIRSLILFDSRFGQGLTTGVLLFVFPFF